MEEQMVGLLQGIVRVGTVSSVGSGGKTARVVFKDMDNLVSADLRVVQQPRDCPHGVGSWSPSVGQQVLCLYIPIQDGDGFILGGV